MAADCGHELKSRGVTMVSLWPGAVKTEYIQVNTTTLATKLGVLLIQGGINVLYINVTMGNKNMCLFVFGFV